jgi:hypothetical protein
MEETKYIKCSGCYYNYINDEKHIKIDFGYNKLEQRYKTCFTCRTKKRNYYELNKETIAAQTKGYRQANLEKMKERDRKYYMENKDAIAARAKEHRKKYREENIEKIKERSKIYREANKEQFNQRRRDKKEQLREEAKNSNGTMNCCGTCIKLKTIDNFKFRNGKTYDICRKCALVRYDTKDLRAEFESGCGGFD